MEKNRSFEIFYYVFCVSTFFIVMILFNTSKLAFIATTLAVIGTYLASKANRFGFILYLISGSIYIFIAYTTKLYGEVILQLFFQLPLYIYGFINWGRRKESFRVEHISIKQIRIILVVIVLVTLSYGYLLSKIDTSYPYLNALSSCFCVSASYLSSKAIIEQWISWIFYGLVMLLIFILSIELFVTSLPYVVNFILFLGIDTLAYFSWMRMYNKSRSIDID